MGTEAGIVPRTVVSVGLLLYVIPVSVQDVTDNDLTDIVPFDPASVVDVVCNFSLADCIVLPAKGDKSNFTYAIFRSVALFVSACICKEVPLLDVGAVELTYESATAVRVTVSAVLVARCWIICCLWRSVRVTGIPKSSINPSPKKTFLLVASVKTEGKKESID